MELAPDTLDRLHGVSSATATSQLLKRGLHNRAIRGVHALNQANCRLVGPAYTLRYVPMREDLITGGRRGGPGNIANRAVEETPPGSVLVMDMGSQDGVGALDDILVARLIARGVAGAVTDGGMRDIRQVAAMALPVFCRGNAPPPSFAALLPADAQVAIGCGGVLVEPGDIVLGDEDGVCVVPRHLADAVARDGWEQERLERWIRHHVDHGMPIPGFYPPNDATLAGYRAWVDAGEPELR